jgi:hypothetical protein
MGKADEAKKTLYRMMRINNVDASCQIEKLTEIVKQKDSE